MTRLADALERARALADAKGIEIFQSSELSRTDRELLVRGGWLTQIVRGWYLFLPPGMVEGDSAAWYAHFWDFLGIYLSKRFGDAYCLSAESSIELHLESTVVPKQVMVIIKQGGGKCQPLPYGTSLYTYADPKNLPSEGVSIRGIRAMPIPLTLCKLSPTFFQHQSKEAAIALGLIREPSDLVRTIVNHGFSRAAGRLVGAYRQLDPAFAKRLELDLNRANVRYQATNPFQDGPTSQGTRLPPAAARIAYLWDSLRNGIVEHFPAPPPSVTPEEYLRQLDTRYLNDAYNSLSIEGYRVNLDLVARVRNHEWDPEHHPENAHERNALAARGYYLAFNQVKISVEEALSGSDIRQDFVQRIQTWYQALWSPFVEANIMKPTDLLGYRSSQVYIRGSRHTPLAKENLVDAMETLERCLLHEEHPAVRAILGHYFFVYIHPYMDGNGRLARFVMNALLAMGGYPWTIVRTTRRLDYFAALEKVNVNQNIGPFATFICEEMAAENQAP